MIEIILNKKYEILNMKLTLKHAILGFVKHESVEEKLQHVYC